MAGAGAHARSDILACLTAGIAAAIAAITWTWPLAGSLTDGEMVGAFHPGHVWCFDHIARMLSGERPWALTSGAIGFPGEWRALFIAWLPAVLVAPLQGPLGPIGAYNVALFGSVALAGVAAWAFFRQFVGPWPAAVGAALFATNPYIQGCVASGQVCKAQVWVLPATLAGVVLVARAAPRRLPIAAAGLGLVVFAGAFSEPSYALQLPFAAAVVGVWLLAVGPGRAGVFGRVFLAAVVCALALMPARAYYADALDVSGSAFFPARRLGRTADIADSVVTLQRFLHGSAGRADARQAVHVVFQPWVLLATVALAPLLRARGALVAVGLVALGVGLGLGETLIDGTDFYRDAAGRRLTLPAAWLARSGYPLGESGMYYRLILLAACGLALSAALVVHAAAERRGRMAGFVVSVIVFGLAYGQAHTVLAPIWSRPVREVPGVNVARAIRAAPGEGAVLDLPLATQDYGGQSYVRLAAVHGRPTTGLPRRMDPRTNPAMGMLDVRVNAALSSATPVDRLRAIGVGFVVWHDEVPREGPSRLAELTAVLGPPRRDGDVSWWAL